mmetsp:Transcript_71430/g.192334  ORF Transcript_71430/g.192334 Transcript_71430/m.192334 type:complete len:248 (+) Transcript_71430:224-967(+)
MMAVRRVIILSTMVAFYYVCGFIWRLLTGMYGNGKNGTSDALWSALSQLAIELSIPACGYYGAMYAHRTLLFFFCGANIIFIVAAVIGFFRLLVILSSSSAQLCQQEYASARNTCDIMTGEGVEKYFLLSSLALLTCLGCLSFLAGKRLYQGLGPFDNSEVHANRGPLLGEVIIGGLDGEVGAEGASGNDSGDAVIVIVQPESADAGAGAEVAGSDAANGSGSQPQHAVVVVAAMATAAEGSAVSES